MLLPNSRPGWEGECLPALKFGSRRTAGQGPPREPLGHRRSLGHRRKGQSNCARRGGVMSVPEVCGSGERRIGGKSGRETRGEHGRGKEQGGIKTGKHGRAGRGAGWKGKVESRTEEAGAGWKKRGETGQSRGEEQRKKGEKRAERGSGVRAKGGNRAREGAERQAGAMAYRAERAAAGRAVPRRCGRDPGDAAPSVRGAEPAASQRGPAPGSAAGFDK